MPTSSSSSNCQVGVVRQRTINGLAITAALFLGLVPSDSNAAAMAARGSALALSLNTSLSDMSLMQRSARGDDCKNDIPALRRLYPSAGCYCGNGVCDGTIGQKKQIVFGATRAEKTCSKDFASLSKEIGIPGWVCYDDFFAYIKQDQCDVLAASVNERLARGDGTTSTTYNTTGKGCYEKAGCPTTTTTETTKYELCLADCAAGDDSTKMCRVSDSEGVATGETAQSSCHLNCMVPMLSEQSDWHMCTRLCNGVPDSATECQELVAADCDASINFLAAEIAQKHCPSLCKTCVTSSTTSTSTSTTTSTTTTSSTSTSTITDTTTNNCRGELDPVEHCFVSAKFCDPLHNTPEIAAFLIATCPVLCNSCVTTSTQTATSVTTTTTKTVTDTSTTTTISTTTTSTPLGECDGVPDNAVCSEDLFSDGSVCTSDVDVIRDEARQLCPALCKLCPTIADCDGKRDPKHVCTPNLVEYCESSIKSVLMCSHPTLGADFKAECLALCNTCIELTTVTSTITTDTVTTTTAICDGKPDPADVCTNNLKELCTSDIFVVRTQLHREVDPIECSTLAENENVCNDPYFGLTTQEACPVLCNSCPTTTATTATQTTVTTTVKTCFGKIDNPQYCTAKVVIFCDNDNELGREVSTQCPTLCNSCPETSPAPVRVCNGLYDPVDVCSVPEEFCYTPVVAVATQLRSACPALCNSCVNSTTTTTASSTTTTASSTTTSASSTTTTVTTTSATTTTPSCNGEPDPDSCFLLQSLCSAEGKPADAARIQCPVTCNTCSDPSCNGVPDPIGCLAPGFRRKNCENEIQVIRDAAARSCCQQLTANDCDDVISGLPDYAAQVRASCLILCDLCPHSSSTTTTETTVTTLTTTSTATATSTTRQCNGKTDPDICTSTLLSFCATPESFAPFPLASTCPVLCTTCNQPTTEAPTVTTTTASTTTVATDCNGAADPEQCSLLGEHFCTDTFVGSDVTRACPTLCNATTTTTATTKTSTTVLATLCNGLPDPESCRETDAAVCTNPLLGLQARSFCPVLCRTCEETTPPPITTAAPTTKEAFSCNGLLDPASCDSPLFTPEFYFGLFNVAELCPAMCDTCNAAVTTAQPTEGPEPTLCNGVPDAETCTFVGADSCTDPQVGAGVRANCPLMCGSCMPTTTTFTATCGGQPDPAPLLDPEVCSGPDIAAFCDLPPEAFGIFSIPVECPLLCNTCKEPTPPPRPECPADDDDLFEQLAIALGGPAGPLSGYSKCADATSWCKAGSGVQPPDSEWSIQSIITLVRDEACQTSCGTC
eukprot:gene12175-15220_t